MSLEHDAVPMAEWFVTAKCIATYHLGIKVEARSPEDAQTKARAFFGEFNMLTLVGLTNRVYVEGKPTIEVSALYTEPAS